MKVIRFHPEGVEFASGEPVGQLYIIGFPRQRLLYVGSTKRGGAIRLSEHSKWLKQNRHPNHILQEAYANRGEGRMERHVVCSLYGVTGVELRNAEWGMSIQLSAGYTMLNEDTTKSVSYWMGAETEARVISVVDEIMDEVPNGK